MLTCALEPTCEHPGVNIASYCPWYSDSHGQPPVTHSTCLTVLIWWESKVPGHGDRGIGLWGKGDLLSPKTRRKSSCTRVFTAVLKSGLTNSLQIALREAGYVCSSTRPPMRGHHWAHRCPVHTVETFISTQNSWNMSQVFIWIYHFWWAREIKPFPFGADKIF
jgi:hypothetical protein